VSAALTSSPVQRSALCRLLKRRSPITPSESTPLQLTGVRVIACFEAFKGLLVLLLGFGALTLIHHDLHAFAEHLVAQLHVSPERPFARAFVNAASNVTNARLWLLAGGGAVYAAVRLVEAWGLWFNRTWAQYFGILSGALYLPWEAYEVVRRPTSMHIYLLAANVAVVLYLGAVRLRQAKAKAGGATYGYAPPAAKSVPVNPGYAPEPRWPSLLTLIGIGILHLA
jgi:uncharacterized membrane protein (DUF2068 family)